jgi:hypothetical protein
MQAKTWQLFGGLAIGIATLIYYSAKNQTSKELPKSDELADCSAAKMSNILEDLRIEYTPYYNHFYQMLVALGNDYQDKPTLQRKLREKIKDRLEAKVEEI